MRFLALQTDIELLKKQFIPEGEHEIMTVARHPIIFIIDFFWKSFVAFALLVILAFVAPFFDSPAGRLTTVALIAFIMLGYLYELVVSYIAWRFNFLIVTSDKVVIINHRSFFHQRMNSLHIDDIRSSKCESQFFGIVRCGIVQINLEEKSGGSTKVTSIRYVPAPDLVASAIENAIAMKHQRAKGTETAEVQQQKAAVIKEELKQGVKEIPGSTPSEKSP